MARVCARDASAFEALYDAYNRLVYGLSLRMLRDVSAAEDATQTVFLKIWNTPHVFRGGNFGAWISRVTRNHALDVLRKRSSHGECELADPMPVDDVFEDTVTNRVDAERARDALAQLPPDQRELIECGFFEGLTHEELARRKQLPLGTVKTRIRAGLRKLRDALSGAHV